MPLPNRDPQLQFPYDVTPEGNSSYISNQTDAGLIDDKIRVLLAETAKALRQIGQNFNYLDEQGVALSREIDADINVYFDQEIRKGLIVFPSDQQERDGTDYITVRNTPAPGNISIDALGMVPANTQVGEIARIRTRGIVKDIFWPTDLTPPDEYQVALIEHDPQTGWSLVDPVSYDTNIIHPGQKMIGFYLDYTPGPPATYSIFLTGFQQSNLQAAAEPVIDRIDSNKTSNRIMLTAANRDVYENIFSRSITPVRGTKVRVTIQLYLDFLSTAANQVWWDVHWRGSSIFLLPPYEASTWKMPHYDPTPADVPTTFPSRGSQGIFERQYQFILDATPREANTCTFRFKNVTRDCLFLRNSFMMLEEL